MSIGLVIDEEAEGKSIPKDLEKRLLEYKSLRTDASTRQRTELTNPPVL